MPPIKNKNYFYIALATTLVVYISLRPQIHNWCGETLFLKFNNTELATICLQLVPDTQKNFYTFFLLGRIYFVQNELDNSVVAYNQSIILNPKFAQTFYGRGLSYGFMGENFLFSAQKDFEKYIKLDEEEFQESRRRAYGAWAGYNDLAWTLFMQGKFQEAESVALQALEFSPENPWLLNTLSVALIEQGKCRQAYPIIQKAENLLVNLEPEKFGEAYSGDHRKWWFTGLEQMKQTVHDNLLLCANNLR